MASGRSNAGIAAAVSLYEVARAVRDEGLTEIAPFDDAAVVVGQGVVPGAHLGKLPAIGPGDDVEARAAAADVVERGERLGGQRRGRGVGPVRDHQPQRIRLSRKESRDLKEVVAELTLENRLLKKSANGTGGEDE